MPSSAKYVLIASSLRRELESASPGDRIASEPELATRFGVSRLTARQAVRLLQDEGLLYRVPGSGTFASGRTGHRTMGVLQSFTDEMRSRNIETYSRVIEAVFCDADAAIREQLRVARNSRVFRIKRIRFGDGTAMALETTVLHPRCEFVQYVDLSHSSLYGVLEAHNIVPTEAHGSLVADSASREDCAALGIAMGSPLLIERRVVEDQHGWRFETSETRYVGSRYILDVNLKRK